MITTKRVSLVVLTIASLCSLNANAMFTNLFDTFKKRRALRSEIDKYANHYDLSSDRAMLTGSQIWGTPEEIAQKCKEKTGYTYLDKTYVDSAYVITDFASTTLLGGSIGALTARAMQVPYMPGAIPLCLGFAGCVYLINTKINLNAPKTFGGAPRLRRQFVRQQYPYFGLAKEQPAETK